MPYCRECFYDLRELPAGKCPECGSAFDPAIPDSVLAQLTRRRTLISLFSGLILLVLVMLAMMLLGGRLGVYLDIPSVVLVLGILFGGLLLSHGLIAPFVAVGHVFAPRGARTPDRLLASVAVLRRAGRLSWAAGVIGFLIGGVTMLWDLSDPSSIGAGLGVAMVAPLYGAVLAELLFFPLADALITRSHLPVTAIKGNATIVPSGWFSRLAGALVVFGCVGLMYVLLYLW